MVTDGLVGECKHLVEYDGHWQLLVYYTRPATINSKMRGIASALLYQC